MNILFQIFEARAQTTDLFNPLEFIPVRDPAGLVIYAIQGFAGVVGIFAIGFIVFNAFRLIIASNEEAIKSARESISWAVGGFAVALLAFTIVSGTAKLLGFEPGRVELGKDKLVNPAPSAGPFLGEAVLFVMRGFLGLAGFATILMLIYYGFKYITAAGNEEAIEQAKTGLKWSIIGFIITLLAFTIVSAVRNYLFFGA